MAVQLPVVTNDWSFPYPSDPNQQQHHYPLYPPNSWQHHFHHNVPVTNDQGYQHQSNYQEDCPVASTSQLSGESPSFYPYENDADDLQLALSGAFSSVSQVEAQPFKDEQTGEWVYPCPFCKKEYGGKHGRSIWRRHLSNKHEIPLNVQPRRTRWDNGEPDEFRTMGQACRFCTEPFELAL